MKKILLAIDGSNRAMDAIRYVGAFLPPTHTEVVMFHVAAEVPESLLDLGIDPSLTADIVPISVWSRQAEKHIQEFMEEGRDVLVQAGFPGERIARCPPARRAPSSGPGPAGRRPLGTSVCCAPGSSPPTRGSFR